MHGYFFFSSILFFNGGTHICAKVANKSIHRPFIEQRESIDRYREITRMYYFLPCEKLNNKSLSYELELRYLFNNYEQLSTLALLSRLCCAHRNMIKAGCDTHSESYERYEQICSALLLQCAQILAENTRKQILQALQDVDEDLVYWTYQKNHPVGYFFGKSPIKWLKGKSQDKEVNDNIRKLEHKQGQLYTTLGKLTTHMYSFADCGNGYGACYDWVEKLLSVLSCIKTTAKNGVNDTQFDTIALNLELKIKHVHNLKKNFLQSISLTKKPHHFVRNWIAYTSLAAAIAYTLHYHVNHDGAMLGAYMGTKVTVLGFLGQLLDPLHKMYARGKQAFSPEVKKIGPETQVGDTTLEHLIDDIENTGESIPKNIALELAKSDTSLLEDADAALNSQFDRLEKRPLFKSYIFDRGAIKKAALGEGKDFIGGGDYQLLDELLDQISVLDYDIWVEMKAIKGLIRTTKGFLEPLQRYTDIIDDNILVLIQLIAKLVVMLGRKIIVMLQDNELTLMFTALIPLAGTSFAAARLYQWITAKNYSPIRLALVDVNALLIEALLPLDDYDYGKLVYLVHKLRDKAYSLSSVLRSEFLVDIAKLESKSFSVETKRGIVENMFNKYTFLGRIAT